MTSSSDSARAKTRPRDSEARCECGQLMAKLLGHGIELKCKRCRRLVIIPFSGIEGWPQAPP